MQGHAIANPCNMLKKNYIINRPSGEQGCQITPISSIELATLRKPAILAPFT
jgi:hypothetical protein